MKTIIFSLLFALYFALIKAGGDPYYATFYGGSEDGDTELNPSCGGKRPDTKYYAAVSTGYGHDLCDSYAVVMAVDADGKNDGKMVKVKIIDSCHECERSHIDLSRYAFTDIRAKKDGEMKVIWVAANSKGKVTRDIVYPSSQTEKFAKKQYGLTKTQFVSMYKKQALEMIKEGKTHATFNKSEVVTTPKTTVSATISATATAPVAAPTPATNTTAPADKASVVEGPVAGLGNITITTGKAKDNSIPDDAPIVGQTKIIDPNKTDYTDEDIKIIESQFPDKEEEESSYTVGVLSAALGVSGAAGIGLIYLKKQSPGKYEELKQKFPEAFNNVKRSVSRSATSLRRGLTRVSSKKNHEELPRHADHTKENYREMPDHMFGDDGLPRITLYDTPMNEFPETASAKN
ncbi:hypothetical protein LY90DRAFT_703723 [Neocallimastix californiae]|uniref:RlpA-like protein double-psi beta-barrel domain-containing protein n=1 Tax=Neocallimastix californiae TaxID=1754190 RepID=A0A1Y2CB45_9FUNG|nr:hypothetical protein LY90DRAFT_703723 [Neocallimastix californiae]|eukprot:ORY43555.1 hypothetical protein LY90DRAFT_703723 [Neocallimastix californiae]